MSDDDLIRRGDAIEALCGRMSREEYGHAKAAVALDIEEIRALPASSSAAERLARAADAEDRARREARGCREEGRSVWAWRHAKAELICALAAYRAAPPAAEPAPRDSWVCAICDGGPANDCACSCPDGGKREPAKEPAPCGTCGGSGQAPAPCPDGSQFIGGTMVSCAAMHTRPCPSCRPGGAT